MLTLAENKLLLFASEFESERIWTMRLALRLAATILALCLAFLFLGAWLTFILWDWHQTLAILVPALIFLGVSALAWRGLLSMYAAKPPAFNQTREELQKDRQALARFCGFEHD